MFRLYIVCGALGAVVCTLNNIAGDQLSAAAVGTTGRQGLLDQCAAQEVMNLVLSAAAAAALTMWAWLSDFGDRHSSSLTVTDTVTVGSFCQIIVSKTHNLKNINSCRR